MSDFFSSDLSRLTEAIEALTNVLSAPNFPGRFKPEIMTARLKSYAIAVDVGHFPFTSFGCYPRFAIASDNEAICPDCCRSEIRSILDSDGSDGWTLVDHSVNYEDSSLYCVNCSEKIASAYGDDGEA